MVWLSNEEFQQEHVTLPRILRSGTKAQREKEAAKQEKEGAAMTEEKKSGESKNEEAKEGGIRRLEIEPAANGGFIVRVVHKEKAGKRGEPAAYQEPETLAFSNAAEVHACINHCFPGTGAKTRSKKGKSETKERGGSRVDTYESAEGDEVGE